MLIALPILLIIISAVIINSADVDNLRIGIVDEGTDYQFNFNERVARNVDYYYSLDGCLSSLKNEWVGVCMHLHKNGGPIIVDVYTDNTNQIVTFFGRQFVLEEVMKGQEAFIERTSLELNEKATQYSFLIIQTKQDLYEAQTSLQDEENLLIGYQNQFSQTKQDFNSLYLSLKEIESRMNSIESSIYTNQQNVINGASNSRVLIQNMRNDLDGLSSYLGNTLGPSEFNFAISYIADVRDNLYLLDNNLAQIESGYSTNQVLNLISDFRNVMVKVESTKILLDRIEKDLPNAISKNRDMQSKVKDTINRLENVETDLQEFSKSDSGISLRFNNLYAIIEDQVFMRYPLLIAIIITFTSLVLSNQFILKGVNHPSYLREIISPTRDINFIITDYFTNMFFIFLQVAILFVVGIFGINSGIGNNLAYSLVVIFLATSIFVLIGMSFGYMFKSQNLSTLFAIFLSILFFVFSDILAPSVLTGPIVNFFIGLNPFVVLNSELSKTMVIGEVNPSFYLSLIKLFILLVMGEIFVFISKKVSRRRALR